MRPHCILEMATRLAASTQPGKWVRGDTSEESLRRFDRWIIAYQIWASHCLDVVDPILTESQRWDCLIAIGGACLHDIIQEVGIITSRKPEADPTALAEGIDMIQTTIPKHQPGGRRHIKKRKRAYGFAERDRKVTSTNPANRWERRVTFRCHRCTRTEQDRTAEEMDEDPGDTNTYVDLVESDQDRTEPEGTSEESDRDCDDYNTNADRTARPKLARVEKHRRRNSRGPQHLPQEDSPHPSTAVQCERCRPRGSPSRRIPVRTRWSRRTKGEILSPPRFPYRTRRGRRPSRSLCAAQHTSAVHHNGKREDYPR